MDGHLFEPPLPRPATFDEAVPPLCRGCYRPLRSWEHEVCGTCLTGPPKEYAR